MYLPANGQAFPVRASFLASRQSKMCRQKHGGFLPNLRHFDVTIDLFLW